MSNLDSLFYRLNDASRPVRDAAYDDILSIRDPRILEVITFKKIDVPNVIDDELFFLLCETILHEDDIKSASSVILCLMRIITSDHISLGMIASDSLKAYLESKRQNRQLKILVLRKAYRLSAGKIRIFFTQYVEECKLLELVPQVLSNFRRSDEELQVLTVRVLSTLEEKRLLPYLREIVSSEKSEELIKLSVKGLCKFGNLFDVMKIYRLFNHSSKIIRQEALSSLMIVQPIYLRKKLKGIVFQERDVDMKKQVISSLQQNHTLFSYELLLNMIDNDNYKDLYPKVLEGLSDFPFQIISMAHAKLYGRMGSQQKMIMINSLFRFSGPKVSSLAMNIYQDASVSILKSSALQVLIKNHHPEFEGLLLNHLENEDAGPNEAHLYWSLLSKLRVGRPSEMLELSIWNCKGSGSYRFICLLNFILCNIDQLKNNPKVHAVVKRSMEMDTNIVFLALEIAIKTGDPGYLKDIIKLKDDNKDKHVLNLCDKYFVDLFKWQPRLLFEMEELEGRRFHFVGKYILPHKRSEKFSVEVAKHLLAMPPGSPPNEIAVMFNFAIDGLLNKFDALVIPGSYKLFYDLVTKYPGLSVSFQKIDEKLGSINCYLLAVEDIEALCRIHEEFALSVHFELLESLRESNSLKIKNPYLLLEKML